MQERLKRLILEHCNQEEVFFGRHSRNNVGSGLQSLSPAGSFEKLSHIHPLSSINGQEPVQVSPSSLDEQQIDARGQSQPDIASAWHIHGHAGSMCRRYR